MAVDSYDSDATYMDSANPGDNNSGDAQLMTMWDELLGKGSEVWNRLLAVWDLSALAGHTINSASIWMTPAGSLHNPTDYAIRFWRVIPHVVISEATWTDYKAATAWPGLPGCWLANTDYESPNSDIKYFAANFDPIEWTGCKLLVEDALDNESGILRVVGLAADWLANDVCWAGINRLSIDIVIDHTPPGGGLQTLTPSPLTIPLVIPAPTLVLTKTLSPTPVAVPLAIPAPTLLLTKALTPDPVAIPLTIPTPTIALTLTLAPDPVSIPLAIPAPTLALTLNLLPDPVAINVLIPGPTIALTLALSPDPVTITTVIPAPTLALSFNLTPDPVVITFIFPLPVIVGGMAELEIALHFLLANYAPLLALTADRVYPLKLPQGPTLPAITYQRISGVREHALASDVGLAHPRIQIDSWGKTFASAKAVATQVRGALQRWADSTTRPVILDSLLESDGEDYEPETNIYRVRQDWIIWHREW